VIWHCILFVTTLHQRLVIGTNQRTAVRRYRNRRRGSLWSCFALLERGQSRGAPLLHGGNRRMLRIDCDAYQAGGLFEFLPGRVPRRLVPGRIEPLAAVAPLQQLYEPLPVAKRP